jgi:hypothetical protein
MVEHQQRVPLWWRQHPNGSFALFRSGLKPIEFEKGKPAIAVSSLDKLPSVIDTLITAVRNGELDQQFAEAAPSDVFIIRSLKVGNRIVHNVRASIASPKANLLLGQSFLQQFNSWSIDNARHALVLE